MNNKKVLQILTGKSPKQLGSLDKYRTNNLPGFKNYRYIFRYSHIQIFSSQFSQYDCLIFCFYAFRNFPTQCNYICRAWFAAEAVLIYAMQREEKQAHYSPAPCCQTAVIHPSLPGRPTRWDLTLQSASDGMKSGEENPKAGWKSHKSGWATQADFYLA